MGPAAMPGMGAGSGLADQGVFQNTYTAYDNVSYTHGSHNFKFGVEVHHSFFHGVGAPGGLTGTLNYFDGGTLCPGCTDLQNFLAGNIGNRPILVNPQQELTSLAVQPGSALL